MPGSHVCISKVKALNTSLYSLSYFYSGPYQIYLIKTNHKWATAIWLINKLEIVKLEHIPKSANKMVEVLANLAVTLALGVEESTNVITCRHWIVAPLDEVFKKNINAVSA